MAYHVLLKPSAQKEHAKLEYRDRLRVNAILLDVKQNPLVGKKLKGKYTGCYSIRVWPIRIIYQIYKKDLLVLVIRIRHRGGAYK